MFQDFRYALRTLITTPAFTIVVVLCGLALGLLFSIALSGLGIIPKVSGTPMMR